jgi:UDP-N-acetyl-D-glucosamine 4,6-dehydratase
MISDTTEQTILVTGASSYVGKFLLKELKKSDYHLILTGRYPEEIPRLHHPKVTYLEGNLLYPESYQAIFDRYAINKVIHLGAMARLTEAQQNPIEAIKVNLIASTKLLDMAVRNGVSRFVFTSTDLARNPTSIVGMCKYLVEDALRLNNSPTQSVVVRLPNVMDSPGTVSLLFKKQIKEHNPVTITHPKMSRRFISGTQAAQYVLYALENGANNLLYINTDSPINICELAQQLMHNLQQQVPIHFIGIKPGENISEPGYRIEEYNLCNIEGLGALKNNEFDRSKSKQVIGELQSLVETLNNPQLTEYFHQLQQA